jgi:hypothetical protein
VPREVATELAAGETLAEAARDGGEPVNPTCLCSPASGGEDRREVDALAARLLAWLERGELPVGASV